jgi:hypothetical protein
VRKRRKDGGEVADRELNTCDETAPADEPLTRERSEVGEEVESTPLAADERTGDSQSREPLLADDETQDFTMRWREIQIAFVDEPRDSVANADALVAELTQRLASSFSDERQRLEGQWDRGDDVSTENLRVAVTRYRSFFDRLLSA